MELFASLVNDFQPLTDVLKKSVLDVVGVLDTPLNFMKLQVAGL